MLRLFLLGLTALILAQSSQAEILELDRNSVRVVPEILDPQFAAKARMLRVYDGSTMIFEQVMGAADDREAETYTNQICVKLNNKLKRFTGQTVLINTDFDAHADGFLTEPEPKVTASQQSTDQDLITRIEALELRMSLAEQKLNRMGSK